MPQYPSELFQGSNGHASTARRLGQRPWLLLMLMLCNCHCPQCMAGRYPPSFGSSLMMWATSGTPGTHGIEQGRNHLLVRDAR